MKKLINSPDTVVTDALRGIAAAHPELQVDVDGKVIVRGDAPVQGKVGIVSGGGSGHEPMHGGYVGAGMLDAACPGEVFTSPTPDQMLAATQAVDGGAGVLHIVKNYTGDVLNFEMAADLARDADIEVEAVVINDDVAVQDSTWTAGRRGVGATVLAEKICGAAAEERADLATVAGLCRTVNDSARSMGIALTSCTVPSAGKPTFELAEDEMEVGIGIHGEPGRERRAIATAAEVARLLCDPVLSDLPFSSGDRVLAFVNGMGGTPLLELYIVYNEVAGILADAGITIARNLVGSYITSLEMAGCSLTLLKLDDELLRLWDAPVNTPALRWGSEVGDAAPAVDVAGLVAWVRRFSAVVDEHAEELTQLDSAIGDADHGSNMRRGFQAVVAALDADTPTDVAAFGKAVGMRLISSVGGASGPLYGSFFLAFGTTGGATPSLTLSELAACWEGGAGSVASRGKAARGDKTMLDAMLPAVEVLVEGAAAGEAPAEVLDRAAAAAEAGMHATTPMTARKGRASYLGERSAGHQDPGATSTWLLVRSAADQLGAEGTDEGV